MTFRVLLLTVILLLLLILLLPLLLLLYLLSLLLQLLSLLLLPSTEPERAEPELKGVEAEPEPEPGPELRAAERTLMASRFLFSPDSFSLLLFLGIS